MTDFPSIGNGGIWIKEGKKGKYLSWSITFAYNGHQVTANGVAFKNDKAEGKQPQYQIKVNDAHPTQPKPQPAPTPKEEEDIPF